VMHTRDFMFMSVCVCVRDVDMALILFIVIDYHSLILFIVIDNVLYIISCASTCNFHFITPNRVS
jgi:hypothetical protein